MNVLDKAKDQLHIIVRGSAVSEKRKLDYHVYLIISALCIIVRILPYSIGGSEVNAAINDLAVGGLASTIVAWLIALAEYRKSKKIFEEKKI